MLGRGLAALVAAITEGRQGWTRPVVLLAFAAAALLITAFVSIEHRRREPLLDLSLLRRPLFLVSTGGALVTGFAVVGLLSYLPTALQLARGFTPIGTALLFSVWSGVSFVTALLARRLSVTARTRLVSGLLLSVLGTLVMYGLTATWSAPRVIAGLVVAGVGYGLINASLTHLSIESVPHAQVSMGSGAGNTARYAGSSMGVAVTTVLVGQWGPRTGIDIHDRRLRDRDRRGRPGLPCRPHVLSGPPQTPGPGARAGGHSGRRLPSKSPSNPAVTRSVPVSYIMRTASSKASRLRYASP